LKERQNREKYISKVFGDWKCRDCSSQKSAADTVVPTAVDSVQTSSVELLPSSPLNSLPSDTVEAPTSVAHAPPSASDKEHVALDNYTGRAAGAEEWPHFRPSGAVGFSQSAGKVDDSYLTSNANASTNFSHAPFQAGNGVASSASSGRFTSGVIRSHLFPSSI